MMNGDDDDDDDDGGDDDDGADRCSNPILVVERRELAVRVVRIRRLRHFARCVYPNPGPFATAPVQCHTTPEHHGETDRLR